MEIGLDRFPREKTIVPCKRVIEWLYKRVLDFVYPCFSEELGIYALRREFVM